MAEAAEITPSEDSLLSEKLSIGKVEYDVSLTSNVLRFTKNVGKGKPPVHRIIQLEDILNVRLSEKPEEPSVTLCFIEKEKKTYWKFNKTIFHGKDIEICKNVREMVLSAASQKVPNRPKRLLVIVNPKSGGSKGQKIFEKQVSPLLQSAGIEVTSLVTERAGHGRDYVQDFDLSSIDGILVVGGDGTMAEIVDGLFRRRCKEGNIDIDDLNVELPPLGVKIGIIPAGTGQGIAMAAYGVIDVETSVLQCLYGTTFPLSAYTCHNAGKCLMVGDLLMSYGLFSFAIAHSEARRDLGKLRYGVGLSKAIWKIPRFNAEVQYKLAKVPNQSHAENGKPEEQKVEEVNGAASNLEEGWESISGEFSDVNTFLIMSSAMPDHTSGSTLVHLVDTRSRISFIKFATRVLRQQSVADLDYVTSKSVSAFRIILNGLPNPEHKDAITAVNLDGDPFTLTDKTIHFKVHGDVLDVFGCQPENWRQGMVKKILQSTTAS